MTTPCNGQGVRADAAQGAKWFRKAADQGQPIAQKETKALGCGIKFRARA